MPQHPTVLHLLYPVHVTLETFLRNSPTLCLAMHAYVQYGPIAFSCPTVLLLSHTLHLCTQQSAPCEMFHWVGAGQRLHHWTGNTGVRSSCTSPEEEPSEPSLRAWLIVLYLYISVTLYQSTCISVIFLVFSFASLDPRPPTSHRILAHQIAHLVSLVSLSTIVLHSTFYITLSIPLHFTLSLSCVWM